jgi:Fe-S-cluster containining protein
MVEEIKNSRTAEKIFLPSLLASFSCEMCGECCSVWEIPVDRDAYQRAIAEMGEGANEHLEVAEPLSHYGYARRKLFDGRCPY